jgi:hypothetical protein
MAPAVSRIKQAIQIAMFFGFPKKASAAAVIPSITPDSASVFFDSVKFMLSPFS